MFAILQVPKTILVTNNCIKLCHQVYKTNTVMASHDHLAVLHHLFNLLTWAQFVLCKKFNAGLYVVLWKKLWGNSYFHEYMKHVLNKLFRSFSWKQVDLYIIPVPKIMLLFLFICCPWMSSNLNDWNLAKPRLSYIHFLYLSHDLRSLSVLCMSVYCICL